MSDKPELIVDGATARKLDRYVEELIEVAAQGQTGFARWHTNDILAILGARRRRRGEHK